MIYEKEVRMVINQYNIDYYQEKMNMNFKIGERIMVPVDILPSTSGVYITTQCEYCGKSHKMHYRRYLQSLSTGKVCCSNCKKTKVLENCISKYGTRSTLRLPEVQNTLKENVVRKYGSLEEYNRFCYNKTQESILKKYGVRNVLCLPEIHAKCNLTMFKNGTDKVFTSKQQLYLCDLFGGILNYPVGHYHLDIFIEDKGVGIEYSGAGHDLGVKLGTITQKQFLGQEKARRSYFINHNFPIIEFISKTDKLPEDKILLDLLEEAYNRISHGSLYEQVNLDNFPY